MFNTKFNLRNNGYCNSIRHTQPTHILLQPSQMRDKVTTPGGCTIGGLLVLEEGRVRGTVARAVREATVVASQLGQGVQGVNGTRF
jgi:pyrroline-5-carboxylate reductase